MRNVVISLLMIFCFLGISFAQSNCESNLIPWETWGKYYGYLYSVDQGKTWTEIKNKREMHIFVSFNSVTQYNYSKVVRKIGAYPVNLECVELGGEIGFTVFDDILLWVNVLHKDKNNQTDAVMYTIHDPFTKQEKIRYQCIRY
jgi:hypothetical protein